MRKAKTQDKPETRGMRECIRFMLGQYLSEYPQNLDPYKVLEMLEKDDADLITVWEPFENWSNYDLATQIFDAAQQLEKFLHNK
jgi:predicted transcriptional regulator